VTWLERFDQPDLEELFFYLVERVEAGAAGRDKGPLEPHQHDGNPLAWS
jgi:hypothetical protein